MKCISGQPCITRQGCHCNACKALAAARANIEKHLGDCANPNEPDSLWENAYVLAHDALVDNGCSPHEAQAVAEVLASEYC